ncbi:hypothetical protein Dsin_008991 [Dipteronia sinensis]|uniref:DUF4283 domain-containing protein n=1 Tax=Dipteronia sinensis TaxID=43782 RepID=A0AAE0APN4_9ROSI|nr:hypothetical protein Dsin_008991 [Dipteronia sinensis]
MDALQSPKMVGTSMNKLKKTKESCVHKTLGGKNRVLEGSKMVASSKNVIETSSVTVILDNNGVLEGPTILKNFELHHKKGQQIQLDGVSSSRNSKLHHEEGISITPTLVNNFGTAHSSYSNVLKVNNIAMRLWGNPGLQEVLANDKGFFFFKFLDDEACSNVLESGPWLFAGRMVILKKWHPRLILTKETCSKIPVWVKLFNIPHEYWNEEGLSHIASAVGKPLYADSLTESMKRISYARVCIEIDATCELVDSFDLFTGDNSGRNLDESVEILVEYQWKPKICTEFISAVNSEIEPSLCPTNLPIKIQCNVLSKETCMEPPPLSSLKVDKVISTSHVENEPSIPPTNLSIHDQCHDLSKERVVDTSNKFAALVEDGDYRNDQCNELCDDADQHNDKFAALVEDDDSPSMASLDHSLWHSKIKNIDGVTIKGISSPTEPSSKKKKKKWTAKKGKVNSSHC